MAVVTRMKPTQVPSPSLYLNQSVLYSTEKGYKVFKVAGAD